MKNLILSLFALFVCLLTTGCYESRVEVEVREDGSGLVTGRLLISERMMMAIESLEDSDSRGQTNISIPYHEKSFREKLGDTVTVIEFSASDLEDGARELTFQLEVPDIILFLNEDKGEASLASFRITKNADGLGQLVFDSQMNDGPMTPELGQLYGIMKGFYMQLSVKMPVPLSSEVTDLNADRTTVTWEFDLRNRAGLARALEVNESLGETPVFATFALDQWPDIADRLPAALTGPAEGITSSSMENDGRLWAQVASLQLTRNHQLLSEEEMEGARFHSRNEEELTIHVLVSWAEDARPSEYSPLVLEEVLTETGESLLEDKGRHSFSRDVHQHMESIISSAKVKAPSPVSSSLRLVKGYVPVVAGTETEKIVIQNPLDLPEGHLFEEEALQQVGAILKEISEKNVKIEVTGKAIDDLELVKADGSRENPGSSRSGMNNQNTYNFTFQETVEPGDVLEITVRLSETKVKVPFVARDLRLP
jgi:hypothetical protein